VSAAPIFDDSQIVLYCGDSRGILPEIGPVDVVVTDPPYGDTSLDWDEPVKGWLCLVETRQVWCFGSMRFWLEHGSEFDDWTYAQEVWWCATFGASEVEFEEMAAALVRRYRRTPFWRVRSRRLIVADYVKVKGILTAAHGLTTVWR
jgi:hypothetical protein